MRANDFKAKRDKRGSVATRKIEKELHKAEKRKKNFTKDDQLSRLQKYEEADKKNKYYKPFQGDPSFRGPKAKRKTTDRGFIPVFFALNILFFIFAIFGTLPSLCLLIVSIAWKDGVFSRLSHDLDFRGEICGVGKLASRPYLYFANPVIDLNVKFCVEKCPKYSGSLICLYDVDPDVMTPFCYTQIQCTASGRYCLPVEPVNKKIADEYLSSPGTVMREAAADITLSADLIFTGSVFSIVIAYLFFELMRRQTRTKAIVWLSIVGCALGTFATAAFFHFEYKQTIEDRCLLGVDKYDCGGAKAEAYKVLTYLVAAAGVVYVFFVIKMRRQMSLGLKLVQLGGEVLSTMLKVRILPFILIVLSFVVGIVFLTCFALAFSVGEIMEIDAQNIDGDRVYVIEYSTTMRILSVFFYLLFQWWINLIFLTVDTIISYCISVWFFEKKKETVVLDLRKTAKIIFRHHMGTIALIAISKLIFKIQATILETLRKTLRKSRQHSNFVRFWQACCLCCIHVQQRFYRYISKHALIQTCIWGDPFKSASQKAFFLLRRHQEQVKNMDTVSTYILFQTKLFCGLLGGVFVYAYMFMFKKTVFGRDLTDVDSFAIPSIATAVLGFFYATTFQGLFDIAIKAVTQCFLLDTEMFVGDQKYVIGFVRDFMESYRIEANMKELKVQEVKDKMAKGGKIVPGRFIEHIDAEEKKEEESGIYSEETSRESGSEDDSDEDDSDEDGSDESGSEDDDDDDDDEDEDDDDEDDDDEDDDDDDEDDSAEAETKDMTHLTSTSQHQLMKSQLSFKKEAAKGKVAAKKEESEEEEDDDDDDDDEDEDEDESEEEQATPAKGKGGNQKSEEEEDDDDE